MRDMLPLIKVADKIVGENKRWRNLRARCKVPAKALNQLRIIESKCLQYLVCIIAELS